MADTRHADPADPFAAADAWLAQRGLERGGLLSDATLDILRMRLARDAEGEPMSFDPTATEYSKHIHHGFAQTLARQVAAGPAAVAALDTETTLQATQLFYVTARPERFELFAHMSAAELFFIDLDSLLAEMLSNQHVRWDAVQSMHVIYLAERLLTQLLQRGAKFVVVAFDCHARLWHRAPQFAAVRWLLLERLTEAASRVGSGFEVKRFAEWWGKEYREYHERAMPEFVLINDGEQFATPKGHLFANPGAAEFRPPASVGATTPDALLLPEADGALFVTMLRLFQLFTVSQRAHVAFTSRLVMKDNGVLAFVTRAYSGRFVPAGRLAPFLVSVAEGLLAAVPPVVPPLSDDEKALVNAVHDHNEKANLALTTREIVAVLGMAAALKAVPADDPDCFHTWVKLHIMANVVARSLPLAQRAIAPATPATPVAAASLKKYLDAFAAGVAPYVAQCREHVVEPNEALIDLFDGGLLANIAATFFDPAATFTGDVAKAFGEDNAVIVESTYQRAYKCAGLKKLKLAPVAPLPAGVAFTATAPAAAGSPRTFCGGAGSMHPLIAALLKDTTAAWKADLSTATPAWEAGTARPAALRGWDLAGDLLELDTPPGVKEQEEEQKNLANLTAKERKKRDKVINEFVTSVQKTAESMGVQPFLHPNEMLCIVQEGTTEAARAGAAAAAVEDEDGITPEERRAALQARGVRRQGITATEQIRRNNAVRLTEEKAITAFELMNAVVANVKKTPATLDADVRRVDKFVSTLKIATDFENFTEGSNVTVEELQTAWRNVVGASERDFVFPTSDLAGKDLDVAKSFAAIDAYSKKREADAKDARAAANAEARRAGRRLDNSPIVAWEDEALLLKGHFFTKFKAHLQARAIMESLDAALKCWRAEVARAREDHVTAEMKRAVPLFRRVQVIMGHLEKTRIRMSVTHRQELRDAVASLGFPATYLQLIDKMENDLVGERHIDTTAGTSGDKKDAASAGDLPVPKGHTPARFQLQYMGHLLPRPKGIGSDNRVPFPPDPWQKDLLDIVDGNGSAVVCAPTSAGKTFISYYCMKKVLRESHDNVVVYVCPTRALINQALADVYGRYGQKSYTGNFSGHQVFGCLGGVDFVRTPFKCQVLVTLADTFESILMSPMFQSWAKKIRYVIFDEIHSIEGSANGDAWERLLMMVKCPFVALSATVGKTDELVAWLNRVQHKRQRLLGAAGAGIDYNVHLVPKQGKINRWSDIEKYAFLPRKVLDLPLGVKHDHVVGPLHGKKLAIVDQATAESFLRIHPVSCMTPEMLRKKFPEDLPFVPYETLEVFDRMRGYFEAAKADSATFAAGPVADLVSAELRRLHIDRFFTGREVSQEEARALEQQVKRLLQLWGRVSGGNFADFEPPAPGESYFNDDFKALVEAAGGKPALDEKTKKEARKALKKALEALLHEYKSDIRDAETAVAKAAVDAAAATAGARAAAHAAAAPTASASSAAAAAAAAVEYVEGTETDVPGTNGAVKKTVTTVGRDGAFPRAGMLCAVHYVGSFADSGEEFDKSAKDIGEPYTFVLGAGKVIKGWEVGVATMRPGECATFVIDHTYAYGVAGKPDGGIPARATLKFEIELVSCTAKRKTGDAAEPVAYPDTLDYVKQQMLPLLATLYARDLLPAICFSFEESDCAALVEHVVSQLEAAEAEYRETKEFKEWRDAMKKKQEQEEDVADGQPAGVPRVRNKDEETGKTVVRVDELEAADTDKDYSVPDVLPQFSFASSYDTVSAEEMKDIERDMKYADDLVYRAFKRGIGMHTAAVKGRLRIHIERLFRTKYLSVVFATETLALGVHSPCRTVVLCGDHVRLNTSQFRQMAGRAGRRGLDWLGHACFLGVSQNKVQRLMTSDLNSIRGHVPVDTAVELRLLDLYDTEMSRPEDRYDRTGIVQMADCLMTDPLFFQGRLATAPGHYEAFQQAHLRYSFDLFVREGLLFRAPTPNLLGSIVHRVLGTHREAKVGAGAFVFAMLMHSGVLHQITAPWTPASDSATQELVYDHMIWVMSYLFSQNVALGVPLEVHRSVLADPNVFDKGNYPVPAHGVDHDVVLQPVGRIADGKFAKGLKAASRRVLDTYTAMVVEWASPRWPPRRRARSRARAPGRLPPATKQTPSWRPWPRARSRRRRGRRSLPSPVPRTRSRRRRTLCTACATNCSSILATSPRWTSKTSAGTTAGRCSSTPVSPTSWTTARRS